MAKKYGFFQMLSDILCNRNEVSEEFKETHDKIEKKEKENKEMSDGYWSGSVKKPTTRRTIG